jgi:hypothetical protein
MPLSHKRDEILSFATTWTDPEITTLSEVSQVQNDTHVKSEITQLIDAESRILATRGWGG